jgi:hypothetical protein
MSYPAAVAAAAVGRRGAVVAGAVALRALAPDALVHHMVLADTASRIAANLEALRDIRDLRCECRWSPILLR